VGVTVAVGIAATLALLSLRSRPEPAMAVAADAALVLSGDVDYLRVADAAGLYKAGAVKALLLTGRGAGGDSADEMKKVALAAGVPDDAIVLERESTTTRENIVFAAPLVRQHGWTRLALVTSRSHLRRALAAARKALPDVTWIPVDVEDAGPPARVRRLRVEELAKLVWYKVRGWA
jgi:uncharacterized SAM-binding protein YcdF (DUF218 family)